MCINLTIFFLNCCSNIVSTQEELTIIDSPEDQHASPSPPSTTYANPKVVQSKEISGFKDFSRIPPE